MSKVFGFIDETRKKFWEVKQKEINELIDSSTGRVRDDMVTRVKCPICLVDDTFPVFEKDGFTFVRCKTCGLLHVNPQLKPDISESFYKKSLMATHWVKVQTGAKEQEWNANAKYIPSLEVLKKLRPKGGKLLDIGCSVGQFMYLARDYGWDPVGVELNEEAAEYAQNHYGLKVHNEYVEDLDLPGESFGLIALWGVIEHLSEPGRMLDTCWKLLGRDGLLLLFFPNGHSLIVRTMRHHNSTVHGRGHLWYFTPHTIRRLLAKHGYKTVEEFSVLPQLHEIVHFLQYNIPYVESEIKCDEELTLSLEEKSILEDIISRKKMGYKLITIAEKD